MPTPLGIFPDGLTTGSVGNQCLEMLLGIAARQEQPVSIVEDGYVALWVKYPFCCAGEKVLLCWGKRAAHCVRNGEAAEPLPVYMLFQELNQLAGLRSLGEVQSQVVSVLGR